MKHMKTLRPRSRLFLGLQVRVVRGNVTCYLSMSSRWLAALLAALGLLIGSGPLAQLLQALLSSLR